MSIVIRLLGGLGNQFFQRFYGLALEQRGYNVEFDKSYLISNTHREYSLGEYFDLPLSTPTNNIVYEPSLKFHESMLNPEDGSTMVGYWQNEKYFAGLENTIRSAMNFHWTQIKPSEKAIKVGKEICTTNSVFFHVRRQDYVDLQHFHGLPGRNYYENAWREIQSRYSYVEPYVFSDDPDWCEESFPKNFYIVHGLSKHEDLRLMAACKHAVIANSSFSWWAAFLGDNQQDRLVIAPKRWFVADIEEEIVPERWTKC